MAEVWKARHEDEDVEVAIKVITSRRAAGALFGGAFRREARAVAALHHPHVVWIFDHGEVPFDAEFASLGALKEGSPYLVMELASEGTLADWTMQRRPWEDIETMLLALLDALAHTHARDMLHRDLKPANVLLCGPQDMRPGLKLSDFGISHVLSEGNPDTTSVSGTLRYMAPEQMGQAHRKSGPWTDLYALGAMTWHLVCGRPLFGHLDGKQLVSAHRTHPLPRLVPNIAVPTGLEGWLSVLLHKSPSSRYGTAADAARALLQLGDTMLEPVPRVSEAPRNEDTTVGDVPTMFTDEGGVLPSTFSRPSRAPRTEAPTLAAVLIDLPPAPHTGPKAPRVPIRVPREWRRDPIAQPARLRGVGLGLFGLRTLPLVGRQRERDQIWSALLDVQRTGSPHLVFVEGPPGSGKARVARWISRRAVEVGAARAMFATHSAAVSPSNGLAAMVARHLRCHRLPRARVAKVLEEDLHAIGMHDPWDVDALTELIRPATRGDRARGVRPANIGDNSLRHLLICRLIASLADDKPMIVVLEDIHRAPEALTFAETLLGYIHHGDTLARPPQVLILATVEGDADALLSEAQRTRFHRSMWCFRVPVGPLSTDESETLVGEILGLAPKLTARVASRAGGIPLFAVQVVGDWVERGMLEPGPDGWQLTSDDTAELPRRLRDLWADRIQRALDGRSEADRHALELAAVLGQEVVEDEWLRACDAAGLATDASLSDALNTRQLSRAGEPNQWAFTHGTLTETLIEQASQAGRLVGHHLACAAALEGPDPSFPMQERRAKHLMAGGQPGPAVAVFLDAGTQRYWKGYYREARAMFAKALQAADAAGLPESDVVRGKIRHQQAKLCCETGEYDQAQALARRNLADIEAYGWRNRRSLALCLLGKSLSQAGLPEQAEPHLLEAQRTAYEARRVEHRAECLRLLGVNHRAMGHLDESAAALEGAIALLKNRVTETRFLAMANLACVAMDRHNLAEAASLMQQARDGAQLLGSRAQLANLESLSGSMQRFRGDLPRAAEHFRASALLYREMGSRGEPMCNLNLALVLLEIGQLREAQERAELAFEAFRGRRHQFAACARLVQASIAVRNQAWERWPSLFAEATGGRQTADRDTALLAQRTGDWAREAGQNQIAIEAYRFALANADTMGMHKQVGELCRSLTQLNHR
jgi:eukaryotic-like serine/threonine-protein kinase